MWEYLHDVISMFLEMCCGVEVDRLFDGTTVMCDVLLDGKRIFNCEDKKRLVHEFIQPKSVLDINTNPENRQSLRGNAVEWDPVEECPICMLPERNFQLACNHIFHAGCVMKIVDVGGIKCPMCRVPISMDVKDRAQLRVDVDARFGHLGPGAAVGGASVFIDLTND